MIVQRAIAIAAIAASACLGSAQAQTLSEMQVPAEFPPASYEGRQYVDSRGCVFVRAGIDGEVNWVPRVTRDRKVICGQQPTFAKSAPAQETAPRAAPEPDPAPKKVVRKPAPKPAAGTDVAAVKAPRVDGAKAKPPKRAPRTSAQPAAPAKPAKPKAVKRVVVRKPASQRPACDEVSGVSARYLRGDGVRCSPQAVPHVTVADRPRPQATGAGPARVAPPPSPRPAPRTVPKRPRGAMTTRIVPSHVYEKQRAARGVRVPEGYEAAWDDGRLNPRRAHQSPAGRTKMQAVWTDTVPRRLVDPRTGQDVTHKYPGLQYPDTSHAAKRTAGGTVATQGRVPKTTQRTAATRDIPARATVSTRSEPAQKMARNASHRYVQAAVYSDRAQAKRAARRLAGTGLPARIGRLSRNGKSYTVVLAGPFRTQPKLDTAMRRVRGAGFSNARLRK